jgi:Fur family transcriptional regulator, ferric uptake regulator
MPSLDIEQNLQSVGLKVTTARVKILQFFHGTRRRHFRAEEVYRHLIEEDIDIGLATVYRALGHLVEAGMLSSGTLTSTGAAIYELNEGKNHDHVVCLRCGQVDEFSDPVIEAQERLAAQKLGYQLSSHHLVLYGYCAHCRLENSTERASAWQAT